MVLGTVSATNAASQQLRLDYITTKPLSSFSAFKDLAHLWCHCWQLCLIEPAGVAALGAVAEFVAVAAAVTSAV